MKDDLIKIGFKEMSYPKGFRGDWLEYQGNGFLIEFNPCDDAYFFIYTDKSEDRGAAPYDYKGIDKLSKLIKAHEEYFK